MSQELQALPPLHEKLLGFLAAGVSQTQAALAVGCSDGLVSQLLETPEFAALLASKRSHKVESAVKHDNKIEDVEEKALAALAAKLPFARGPMETARIFQILNTAKKRSVLGTESPEALGAQQVTFVLPKHAAVQIQMNTRNQVVEISGRSMATLPSGALPALAAAKKESSDAERAENLLSNLTTTINGVVCVL
jgi:hypothetical protein